MSTNILPRSTPEAQGVSSSAITAFLEAINESKKELHSFMLLRHGQVIAEGWWSPYAAEKPHMLFSLSKSFTSTAIGMASAEGLLSIDDAVLSFFPEEKPSNISENLAKMQVRHLLCMGTGHAEDTTGYITAQEDDNWVKGFLSRPVDYEPGTHFVYNSGATYMLSAIIQKVTGRTLIEYLQPRLFEPLGIEGATWDTCPRGINTGGWGLKIKTEDIAKFGQLYLQKGNLNGNQLIPQKWIEEATSKQISNEPNDNIDWRQGYGYQFWRCCYGAYRGDGAFGQYCIVIPEHDAVIAITSGVDNMQAVLDLVWKHLLPGMKQDVLPNNAEAIDELQRKLTSLTVALPFSKENTLSENKIYDSRFVIEENEDKIQEVSLSTTEDTHELAVKDAAGGVHKVSFRIGSWVQEKTDMFGFNQDYASIGHWTSDHTLVVTIQLIETPFSYTVSCDFTENQITVKMATNVSFGPNEFPVLIGHKL